MQDLDYGATRFTMSLRQSDRCKKCAILKSDLRLPIPRFFFSPAHWEMRFLLFVFLAEFEFKFGKNIREVKL